MQCRRFLKKKKSSEKPEPPCALDFEKGKKKKEKSVRRGDAGQASRRKAVMPFGEKPRGPRAFGGSTRNKKSEEKNRIKAKSSKGGW